MEERLHSEYKDLRKKGLKVKGWWFRLRARQILGELQPEANFCYSDAWFSGFKKKYRLSMRHATNTCQKESGHHVPLHSVMAQHMPILANALSGCVEVLLGLKNVSAQPSLPFLLMVNQE